jgi:uncharacterized protein (TIGR02594 family)
MRTIQTSAFSLAQRYVGVKEVPGHLENPIILAMLQLDASWPQEDEVAWCSAFVNWFAWMLRLPRSKSLRARSWLLIGEGISDARVAEAGFDVVILKRGPGSPGPEVLEATGHVGFFAGYDGNKVLVLGGNQGNAVTVAGFPVLDVLGIRRLA